MKITPLDLSLIALYFVSCLFIGLYRFNKVDTPKKFALGYSTLPNILLTCVVFASVIGAGTIFGYTEKLYSLGIAFLLSQLIQPIFWLIMANLFGKNIDKFSGCFSIGAIMNRLYGIPGRYMSGIASVIYCVGIVAAQALAIGHIFEYFFDIDLKYGIIISYSILTFYSALGGVRAVVFTEAFQFFIFLLVLPVSCMLTLSEIEGGLSSVMTNFPVLEWGLEINNENALLILSFVLFALIPACTPPIIQRCLMASGSKQLESALKNAFWISIPFTLCMCFIGYIASATYPNMPAGEVLLVYINNLPVVVKGLMITGIIGAIMGLAESWLNSTSVIISHDIVKPLFPKISDRVELILMRIFVILLSIASTTIAISGTGIIDLIWLIVNFWEPIILVPLAAGFLGFKGTSRTFIASAICAMIGVFAGRVMVGELATISWVLGIVGSSIGLFCMHYFESVWLPAKPQVHQYRKVDYNNFAFFTLAYYFLYVFNTSKGLGIFTYMLCIGYVF